MEYKHVFLDTNILVDIVSNRAPFSANAIKILDECKHNQIKMYCSSHSIATMHYIAKKIVDEKELRSIIEDLLVTVSVIAVTENIIKKSLKSQHKDFEDAIQIVSVQSLNEMDCIITRDSKDFKNAELAVFSPDKFLTNFNLQ